MNVLVLMGSPRRKGNTSQLCDAFIEGATDSGHKVEKVTIIDCDIHGCLGCNGCQRNGGVCVQKDDMQDIYQKILVSDVIVLGFPIYYYTWTAQLKLVLDRTYALLSTMHNKQFYMLSTCASPDESYCTMMIDSFKNYVDCFDETNTLKEYLFGYNTTNITDIQNSEALKKAYELGKLL